jgi:hypothetical protein
MEASFFFFFFAPLLPAGTRRSPLGGRLAAFQKKIYDLRAGGETAANKEQDKEREKEKKKKVIILRSVVILFRIQSEVRYLLCNELDGQRNSSSS